MCKEGRRKNDCRILDTVLDRTRMLLLVESAKPDAKKRQADVSRCASSSLDGETTAAQETVVEWPLAARSAATTDIDC